MYDAKNEKEPLNWRSVGSSPASAILGFCYTDNIKESEQSQFSEDSEIQSKFNPKKLNSLLLSESYKRLADNNNIYINKWHRVADCGSFLSFAHEIDELGEISEKGKLHNANFCRDRLCPMCSWRRSFKIFGQVSQIMEQIGSQYQFLFLTLTIPNVKADELSSAIDKLMSSWNRFAGYKKIKKVLKGYFRALEVTYNKEQNSFHPHFHVVLTVPIGYLTSRDYISRDEFLALWKKATRDNSITQVDIRVCKSKYSFDELKAQSALASAVAEVAKYAVKSSDYLFAGDEALTDFLVETFSESLRSRRLSQFGGIFKEVYKQLKFEDAESESADLIHVNDKLNPALAWLICRYSWGIGTYNLVNSYVESASDHLKN